MIEHIRSLRGDSRTAWEGGRLGTLGGAAPGPHLALLVQNIRHCRRFDPDIGVAADTFGGERQDIAVQVAHEGTCGHFERVGVAPLFHEDDEHSTQETRTAVLDTMALFKVRLPRRQQLRFLQQGIEPPIREVLG